MKLDIDLSKCDECGTCISVCPVSALFLTDKLGIDTDKCILCKNCVSVCPVGALNTGCFSK